MRTKDLTIDVEGLVLWLGACSSTMHMTTSAAAGRDPLGDKLLVDSVLRGFPLPPVWVARAPWGKAVGECEHWIVEGSQRVDALDRYLRDEFPLLEPDDAALRLPGSLRQRGTSWAGRRFGELSGADRSRLLGARIDVRLIVQVGVDELVAFALRLQPSQVVDAAGALGAAPA